MDVWIIRNTLSDGSETFDVHLAQDGAVIVLNCDSDTGAFLVKEQILTRVNGFSVDLRNAS
jgi:hypothetical protein